MNSVPHIVHALQYAFTEASLPPPTPQQSRDIIGLSLTHALSVLQPTLRTNQQSAIIAAYQRFYDAQTEHMTLFQDVPSSLKHLQTTGSTLAIATGKGRQALNKALALVNLSTGIFSASRTSDDCASKPDPEMILSLIDEFNVSVEKTIMIGDSSHDLNMAKNAGVKSIGVSYGAHTIDKLQQCQPIAIFNNFKQLTDWLSQ